MVGKHRLTKATLGIVAATHIAMSVPEGSIIEIPTAALEGDRTVEVFYNGTAMVMFVRDLADRATKV
jgi:hypothetical protein